MSNANKLLRNTIMLTAASFIMRTVSVSFNVYLTNKIGADGIGLFQLICAVYSTAVTFSVAGIRLAAMRLIADNSATGKDNHRQIMRRCLFYSLVCGAAVAAVMGGCSRLIGNGWIGSSSSVPSLKVLCLSLPFVSMSAALGGYFTSVGKIVRYTMVQFAEQIFKIAVTVIALKSAVSYGKEAACVAIVTGMTAAEIFSFCCSFILYKISVAKPKILEKPREIWHGIFRISVPDAIGSEMRSVLYTVEHLLIPVGFKKSGSDPQAALAAYGTVHGMSLPLVLYPSALLSSLSGLLVPEIAAYHIAKNSSRISYMIARVIHFAMLFAVGTAGIMFFNAEKLSLAVYGNDSTCVYIQLLSPLVPVMYMDMTIDGMLKGLDQQVSYMRYNIIDASLCVILVYFLVPIYSVKGYIIVIFASEIINFFLSFRRLTIVSEVKMSLFKDIAVPLLCIISANLIKGIVFSFISLGENLKLAAAAEICVSCVAYALLLIVFEAIDSEEIGWLSGLSLSR